MAAKPAVKNGARKKLSKNRLQQKTQSLQEVSADDVIKQLLDLFDVLGVDAGGVADRVGYLTNKSLTSQHLYPHVAAIGELLTCWHQDPSYLDRNGNPRPLKLSTPKKSFRFLAKTYVPHMEPKDLLSNLERVGAVSTDADGHVRVKTRSLPVYHDKRLAMQHTLTVLDSFIKTLRHNLDSAPSNSNQLFHRIARNGSFDLREIPALKIKIKRHGQNFLESCDNWMLRRANKKNSLSKSQPKYAQVSIGVYLSVDKI